MPDTGFSESSRASSATSQALILGLPIIYVGTSRAGHRLPQFVWHLTRGLPTYGGEMPGDVTCALSGERPTHAGNKVFHPAERIFHFAKCFYLPVWRDDHWEVELRDVGGHPQYELPKNLPTYNEPMPELRVFRAIFDAEGQFVSCATQPDMAPDTPIFVGMEDVERVRSWGVCPIQYRVRSSWDYQPIPMAEHIEAVPLPFSDTEGWREL